MPLAAGDGFPNLNGRVELRDRWREGPVEEMQLPGMFVVGQDARVRFAHYAVSSADNPPVADVLAAVRNQAVSRSPA